MHDYKIEAHKITKPIQLMAVWLVALLLIDSSFFVAAAKISQPSWISTILVISAIVFVPLFLGVVFLMLTVFRKELQEDQYYSEWLKRNERFRGFKAENSQATDDSNSDIQKDIKETSDDLENVRIKRYEDQEGLFLVHSWRPSITPGQVADIVIWLHQHGVGPLSRGEVEKVEYQLGPKFFKKPNIKTNAKEKFRLDVSAYGPMLCIARVFLKGKNQQILLERYINFEDTAN